MKKKSRANREKELEAQLKRAVADYHNLIKRIERERAEIRIRASKDLVEELLPVLDILEEAVKETQGKGIGMAVDHFKQVLANAGLGEVKVVQGDKFDERIHEAVELKTGGKHRTLAKVLRKGYKWDGGLVLRPAQVEVYK